MEKLEKLDERAVLIAIAVQFGRTRLIDNIVLHPSRQKSRTAVEA
jgi:pantothenate synthetase